MFWHAMSKQSSGTGPDQNLDKDAAAGPLDLTCPVDDVPAHVLLVEHRQLYHHFGKVGDVLRSDIPRRWQRLVRPTIGPGMIISSGRVNIMGVAWMISGLLFG